MVAEYEFILCLDRYLSNYIKANSGTLCVYLDDLEDLNPLFCVVIDLSYTLQLNAGQAYVGFSASTGLHFENHDILNWTFAPAS